jgi:methyltransferase
MILGLAVALFAMMIAEAAISHRHDVRLRAQGAIEPAGDVYAAMQVAYPGIFILMLGEGFWRGVHPDGVAVAGLAVLAVAKALKYWAIATLGERWTFRVLVPPGSERTRRGPYRWLSHPNYMAVVGEIAGGALASHAWVTGPIAFALFGTLMLQRIRVEEAALSKGRITSP